MDFQRAAVLKETINEPYMWCGNTASVRSIDRAQESQSAFEVLMVPISDEAGAAPQGIVEQPALALA